MAKKQFDKKQWLEEKAAKIGNAKEALEAGLAALQTGDEWANMLRATARNIRRRFSPSRYSFGNQILLACQRGEVTSVATFKAWQSVGRSVKKGEHGMYILTPKPWKKDEEQADGSTKTKRGMSFGIAHVFDVSQTEGEPLPEEKPLCRDVEDDATFEHDVDALAALARTFPEVSGIDVRPRARGDHPETHGWYSPSTKQIVVISSGVSRAHQFKTMVHEVTHAILHPLGSPHSYPVGEVEAESVAFIVCNVLGLSTEGYSFPYVAVWASRESTGAKSTELVAKSGDRIVKTATRILDALLGAVGTDDDEMTKTEEEVAA